MNVRSFWVLRKAKKACRSLKNDFRLYQDILPEAEEEALNERFKDLEQAIKCREIEDLPNVVKTVEDELHRALPKSAKSWSVEWFDIIVSALAVAFCFRAYFYEPFQIPTGSMQPTLYGIHTEAAEPTAWDAQPLRFVKWLVTGESFLDVKIEKSGTVLGWTQDAKPGYTSLFVQSGAKQMRYDVPSDIATQAFCAHYPRGMRLNAGMRIWKGVVKSGDFLFVNRWIWNFRHPRLGETIVFSTQGLKGLPDNQHYIKRLCGRPGDTVELKADSSFLWVNGKPATQPLRLSEIAEHLMPWEGAPRYLGYQPAPPQPPQSPYQVQNLFELGPGEYLAFGDNSGNSLDSRYWGKVPARNLLGPASFVHWPFTSPRWGSIR